MLGRSSSRPFVPLLFISKVAFQSGPVGYFAYQLNLFIDQLFFIDTLRPPGFSVLTQALHSFIT